MPLQSPQPSPDPRQAYARLVEHLRPGSSRRIPQGVPLEPPDFARPEDIRAWLSQSVMSAVMYQRFPDARWTLELVMKEQTPGPVRILVL